MNEAWEFLKGLTNPESIIRVGGIALLVFVIFAETIFLNFFEAKFRQNCHAVISFLAMHSSVVTGVE